MTTSASLDDYKINVASELKKYVTTEGALSKEVGKDMFEKKVLRDITTQEVFSFMGKTKDVPTEMVSKEKNPVIYDMYTLIYNSLNYYTVDELKTFRTYISQLTTKKESYLQNMKAKGTNQEKYLLGLVGNQKILLDKEFQKTKNSYALFFTIFQTKEANILVMDLTSL